MGIDRVCRNVGLDQDTDVIVWAQQLIENAPSDSITRRGKNWYIIYNDILLTVNAHSYTLITAHKVSN